MTTPRNEQIELLEKLDGPATHKLLRALMQFRRIGLRHHHNGFVTVKPSEWRVLMCIRMAMQSSNGEIKVSEISRLLQVTSPTVTQLLKGLENQELIERRVDPSDRRAVGLVLTEKGKEITRQAEESFTSSIKELVQFLGEEDSNQLAELLLKVSRFYSEKASDHDYNEAFWSGEKNND